MKKADLILHNAYVVTMDQDYSTYPNGAIAILNGKIESVGEAWPILAAYDAKEIVDCCQNVLMPGFVNGHSHMPMCMMRGFADDLRLDTWLDGYIMPTERRFVNAEYVRCGTMLGCAEFIRSGITTFADMYYYVDEMAETVEQSGLRAILGETILDFASPTYPIVGSWQKKSESLCEKWAKHDRITYTLAEHAVYTVSIDTYKKVNRLLKKYDLPSITHIAETAQEAENCITQHGKSVVQWLEESDFFETKHQIGAHCVYLHAEDMKILQKYSFGAIHCPSSNLKIGVDIIRSTDILSSGINLGIGTDGATSNNACDMVEEYRIASLLAKSKYHDPTVMNAKQTLCCATRMGAYAIGIGEKTGSLEKGKQADILSINLNQVHTSPHYTHHADAIYSALVYSLKSTDISDVIVDGKFLMRSKCLQTIPNETEIMQRAQKIADQISSYIIRREQNLSDKLTEIFGASDEITFKTMEEQTVQLETLKTWQFSVEEKVLLVRINGQNVLLALCKNTEKPFYQKLVRQGLPFFEELFALISCASV